MTCLHLLRAPGSHPQRFLRGCVLAALAACAALQVQDDALAATATIGVVAHVRARTWVETSAPAVIAVTPDDVQRGWIEVSEPVALTVRSNAVQGPSLIVSSAAGVVKGGVLTGFSDPVDLGSGQETIQLAPQKPGEQVRYLLNVRLQLAPGVEPGPYAFPLRFHSADAQLLSSASR